ncbi:hypothetical protein K1T35_34150 [Pseudonocardia sp. DSM 110487]|uniref:hypothetical protein n=1 Tax=Pseudonocardia sp. DSM 110487 TaxID=2865833 RepID=UPI001C696802|nr:hypothetical protein [Pseudonocardia sp. DSM 110487]QYN33508.1 hypothetical protein K1T35_34150 [Pseudonocardia sp. DSM 110487]
MRRTRTPPPAVQERLIAALLPDVHAEPPPHSPAPLPTLPAPALPTSSVDDLLVGMARIDRSGRLHERRLLHALGWAPGQRLALDVVHGLIVVQPARTGSHALDSRGALPLPAAARHMCGIEPGPPVLLAASVAEQSLVIQP